MSLPRLTVATSFPVFPPRGGGQQRVFELYRALAGLGFEIDVVTLADRHARAGRREIAPRLHELSVPRTREFETRERALDRQAGVPVGDVALALHHDLVPHYGAAIAESARDAVAVVACHPYPLPAIAAATVRPLIYEAQDVEIDLKASVLAESGAAGLLETVETMEARCCADAALVLACSEQDSVRLCDHFGVPAERMTVVPNGVDLDARPFVDLAQRRRRKRELGLGEAHQALFIGSWHEPNLVAVRDILVAAEELPDVRFVVVGSAGLASPPRGVPANVDVCGVVDGGFVKSLLGLADVALNPMRVGSGTNLKMLDYAASGAPLISTEVGVRGLGMEPGRHFASMEPNGLAAAVAAVRDEPAKPVAARVAAARARVEESFDWRAIASRLAGHEWMREHSQVAA
jgi:glycosyltransferase involved in cell wall biosynthesis